MAFGEQSVNECAFLCEGVKPNQLGKIQFISRKEVTIHFYNSERVNQW